MVEENKRRSTGITHAHDRMRRIAIENSRKEREGNQSGQPNEKQPPRHRPIR